MKKNIKDLIANVTKKNKKENIVTVGRYDWDSPEVRINDTKLTVTLGQWMGILPDSVKMGGNGMYVISSLDASELIKKKDISKKEFATIIRRFSNILRMIGISSGNTCILDGFDEKELSFRCNLFDTGEIATMRIRFGSWMDEGPTFIVEFDGIKSTYDYCQGDKKNPDRLYLSNIVKDLDKEGNKKFYHYVSEFRYIASVYDNENKVEVEIKYPDALEYNQTDNPYVNEELLEEILSSVSFPVDIEALVAKIPGTLSKEIKGYPTISVVVMKLEQKDYVTTDEAIFKNGEFDKLTLTRNGRKITVDQFDTWSYSTDIANVSQTTTPDHGQAPNYGYKAIPVNELEHLDSPQELVNEAKKEVEEVKTLAKTMLTKRTTE